MHLFHRIVIVGVAAVLLAALGAVAEETDRPNILWLSTEDIGPHLGAYGHRDADTPNLDAFAERAVTYTRAWSDAPVCAPARTAIISGMDPVSLGAQHMRSGVDLPRGAQFFPEYLREAGYYTTNNSKTDYNLRDPGQAWDESNNRAHYRNRDEGQPFFAVFNSHMTHESRVFGRFGELDEIPDDVRVPAHHPDIPEARRSWATYNMLITEMDAWFGERLAELEDEGLLEETIVMFWGDHGAGLPRHKRWPFNSGNHVPLIIYIPEKFQHLAPEGFEAGTTNSRMVAFQDLGPTLLSLAGIEPPEHMQGKAFLGEHADEPREYLYGFRGRMDERVDMVRSIRNERFVYIRNYMPHRIYGQYLEYMYRNPLLPAWDNLYHDDALAAPATFFYEPKPAEELYDLENDPDEVNNLAHLPEYQEVLAEFREAARRRALEIRDTGFAPEGMIHRRSGERPPYEWAHDADQYPLEEIFEAAELAARRDMADVGELGELLSHEDEAVRYWAATGLVIRGQYAVWPFRRELRQMMTREEEDPNVRVAAAEALAFHGDSDDVAEALASLVELADLGRHDTFTSLAALNVVDLLGRRARPIFDDLLELPRTRDDEPWRSGGYPGRMFNYFEQVFPERE